MSFYVYLILCEHNDVMNIVMPGMIGTHLEPKTQGEESSVSGRIQVHSCLPSESEAILGYMRLYLKKLNLAKINTI